MASTLRTYPHRLNRDGSFDSICLKCFATVANTETETELKAREKIHICDHALLCDRHLFRAPHSSFAMNERSSRSVLIHRGSRLA
jgi:hypothetical protein